MKGRFIAILAVLGLLLVLLPAIPASGAVAGTVDLDKTVYSDKTGFNIATIDVMDEDLSIARVGTARIVLTADAAAFDLKSAGAILGGETSKTDKFNGTGVGGATAFTLSKTPRDTDNDGVLEDADVTVVVGGATLTPTVDYAVNHGTKVVTLGAAPAVGTENVVITYAISEYDQTTPANTPVRLFGTSIKFGTTLATATSSKNIDNIDNATGVISATSAVDYDGADNVGGNADDNDTVVVTFVYDVSDTKTSLFTVSTPTSVASGKNRVLNASETTPASNTFRNSVALFSAADLATIESESTDATNDGADAGTTVEVAELNNTAGLGTALNTRVQAASTALGLTPATTLASTFIARIVPVANGDVLTVTYVDASPSATKTDTASIDLAPPTVTLVQPADNVYTSSTTVTLEANVIDTGAGVDPADITLVPPTGVAGSSIKQPITGGYGVSFAPSATITEGAKTWFIAVKDKVGNTPVVDDAATTTVNEGARGAAPAGAATADNPFKFTVDTEAPAVANASTGYYLKFPGVTSGTDQEAQSDNNRMWVRLVFTLGTGGAPISAASVSASDFRVDGAAPISVYVNAKAQEAGAIPVGSAVYLEVPEQVTDARPKVELVGEILDKAGNARTAGTITAATDKLSPVLTVSASPTLHEKTVTISVTSSENLVVNPTVRTTPTEPVDGAVAGTTAQSVAAAGSRLWTATFTNPTGAASKQWVVVSGTDVSGNAATYGDDLPDKEQVAFQVDDAAPAVISPAATGTANAGAVWITVQYDEQDYTGDSYKTVSVTSATLDAADVKSELFSGTIASGTETHATQTLARELAVGTYVFKITVADSAGNSTAFTHTLTVTARPKFDIVLKPGVNLISLPGTPVGDGGNINVMLAGLPVTSVVTYDRSLDVAGSNPWLASVKSGTEFTGEIAYLEPGRAYFVTADARATIQVDIAPVAVSLPPLVQLYQGFNVVGFWSIEGALAVGSDADADSYFGSVTWTVAYSYDPTPGVGWKVIRPNTADRITAGVGYVVYVTQDGTLTP